MAVAIQYLKLQVQMKSFNGGTDDGRRQQAPDADDGRRLGWGEDRRRGRTTDAEDKRTDDRRHVC